MFTALEEIYIRFFTGYWILRKGPDVYPAPIIYEVQMYLLPTHKHEQPSRRLCANPAPDESPIQMRFFGLHVRINSR